ncbi:MAG TPA: hypothetical protein VL860_01910, partial [Planctomycetota bacterium]|nr:hypothetical protein [Planctomycetota bacterium]
MKRLSGSALLLCLSCLVHLAASDEIVHPDSLALHTVRPMFRPRSPLAPPVSSDFDAWSLSLQNEFFDTQISRSPGSVSRYMADRAFGDQVAGAKLMPWPAVMPTYTDYRTFALSPALTRTPPGGLPAITDATATFDATRLQSLQRLQNGVSDLQSWLLSPRTQQDVDAARRWLSAALTTDRGLNGKNALSALPPLSALPLLPLFPDVADLPHNSLLGVFLSDPRIARQIDDWSRQATSLNFNLFLQTQSARLGDVSADDLLHSLAGRIDAIPTNDLLRRLAGRLDPIQTALTDGNAGVVSGEQALQKLLNGSQLQSLQLSAGQLSLSSNGASAQQIEFAFGGNRFSLANAAWVSQRDPAGGRNSFLDIGATNLNLASGDFTRFQDLRFGLHTSAGSFRAAGSITGLDFQFGRRRFQLDAAAFAIDNDPAGLRLQAIVYPHDPHAGTAGLSHRPGIYFSATSDDLAIMQQVQDLFSAPGGTPDLKAVLALLRSHPRLFGNNYMVVFSGQA